MWKRRAQAKELIAPANWSGEGRREFVSHTAENQGGVLRSVLASKYAKDNRGIRLEQG